MEIAQIELLNNIAAQGIMPDLTLIPDLPPAVGLARARGRNAAEGIADSEGRFETEELAFHTEIRRGFLALAARHPSRIAVLDGSLSPDAVTREAMWLIRQRMR